MSEIGNRNIQATYDQPLQQTAASNESVHGYTIPPWYLTEDYFPPIPEPIQTERQYDMLINPAVAKIVAGGLAILALAACGSVAGSGEHTANPKSAPISQPINKAPTTTIPSSSTAEATSVPVTPLSSGNVMKINTRIEVGETLYATAEEVVKLAPELKLSVSDAITRIQSINSSTEPYVTGSETELKAGQILVVPLSLTKAQLLQNYFDSSAQKLTSPTPGTTVPAAPKPTPATTEVPKKKTLVIPKTTTTVHHAVAAHANKPAPRKPVPQPVKIVPVHKIAPAPATGPPSNGESTSFILPVFDTDIGQMLQVTIYAPQDNARHYVVNFSEGFAQDPTGYQPYEQNVLADSGYFVVAVDFPDNFGSPDPVKDAQEMAFVDRYLFADAQFKNNIYTNKVAVTGHSDGSLTALHFDCGDNGGIPVAAAVMMSGFYDPNVVCAPTLLAVGTRDEYGNENGIAGAYNSIITSPKYELNIAGAPHAIWRMPENNSVDLAFLKQEFYNIPNLVGPAAAQFPVDSLLGA